MRLNHKGRVRHERRVANRTADKAGQPRPEIVARSVEPVQFSVRPVVIAPGTKVKLLRNVASRYLNTVATVLNHNEDEVTVEAYRRKSPLVVHIGDFEEVADAA